MFNLMLELFEQFRQIRFSFWKFSKFLNIFKLKKQFYGFLYAINILFVLFPFICSFFTDFKFVCQVW
jgi:hypothetical protein